MSTSDDAAEIGTHNAAEGGPDKRAFRRDLDALLRRRDPEALRAFLIAAGQWQEEHTPADLERAMWMMVAASPALVNMHGEAGRWLVAHGHETEARAILGRAGSGGGRPTVARPPAGPRQGGTPRQGGSRPAGPGKPRPRASRDAQAPRPTKHEHGQPPRDRR